MNLNGYENYDFSRVEMNCPCGGQRIPYCTTLVFPGSLEWVCSNCREYGSWHLGYVGNIAYNTRQEAEQHKEEVETEIKASKRRKIKRVMILGTELL